MANLRYLKKEIDYRSGRGGFRLRYGNLFSAFERDGDFRGDAGGRGCPQRPFHQGEQSRRAA